MNISQLSFIFYFFYNEADRELKKNIYIELIKSQNNTLMVKKGFVIEFVHA